MNDAKVSVTCYAGCDVNDILAPLGLHPRDLYPENQRSGDRERNGKGTATKPKQFDCAYDYVDATGAMLYQVVRWKEPKGFAQRRPDANKPGGWVWSLSGVDRVLYRLPDVLAAKEAGRTIYLCEGEKDADNLADALGVCATTNAGGVAKWTESDSATLAGAEVVILPDNDKAGIAGAWKRADSVPGAVVLLLPGLSDKGDVTDWLNAGGTLAQLEALGQAAGKNPPERPPVDSRGSDQDPDDIDPFSDLAMARRLAALANGNLLHATDRGWLVWDGKRYAPKEKAARRQASKVGGVVRQEGHKATTEPDQIKQYYSAARRAQSAAGIDATLKIAANLPEIDADGIVFDADSWSLNCANGTVDLKSGEFRPHSRADYNTKVCPHPYDPEAKCPRWRRFQEEVFEGDRQMVDWFQWLCWYTATGSTHRHILPILYGTGRNGKSVLFKALRHVLGEDYAVSIEPEDLMIKHNGGHNHSIPRLRGARFAMAQETAENRRIDEALVKQLTGGDPITGRELYGKLFEFTPSHTLWMATNYRPRITGTASGIWDRVRLVPFERRFDEGEQDPNLDTKLASEAPGILAWIVAGGKIPEPSIPDRVRVATDAYREDSDVLAGFIDEYLTTEWEHAKVLKREVYDAYRKAQNNHCESFKEFNSRLEKRGFESDKSRDGYSWRGVAFRAIHATRDVGDVEN